MSIATASIGPAASITGGLIPHIPGTGSGVGGGDSIPGLGDVKEIFKGITGGLTDILGDVSEIAKVFQQVVQAASSFLATVVQLVPIIVVLIIFSYVKM